MFHRHKEGERIPMGFSIMEAEKGKIYGFAFNLFRRVVGVIDWGAPRIWVRLDLERDHKMYRPNDVDSMVCRRCNLPTSQAPSTCTGKSWTWRWYRKRGQAVGY